MRKIVVLGKGGIGKSTLVANLAILSHRSGQRTLQMGCDPKHDSYLKHACEGSVETVISRFASLGRMNGKELEQLIVEGRTGVHVLEAGGPEPGQGCAGRAVSITLDLLNDYKPIYERYDQVFYDVLGDVVCGGFAAPLRDRAASDVIIVASAEYMAVYAANNIARGIRNLANIGGARLIGVIGNRIHDARESEVIETFAARIGTTVLGLVPYSRAVARADAYGMTVIEQESDADLARCYQATYARIAASTPTDRTVPTPLCDAEVRDLVFEGQRTDLPSGGSLRGAP